MDPTPRRVLWSVLAGMFASGFTITIFVVVLDDVAADLGSTRTTLTWVVTAPTLVVAMTMALFGKLGDLRGHRRIFLMGLWGYGAVAVLSALAWDAGSLIAFRALGGLGFAAVVPTGSALVLGVHRPEDRARVLGLWSLVSAGAPLLGIVLGGPLVDAVGWRWIFLAQAPMCLIASVACGRGLRETPGSPHTPIDLAGTAMLMTGAGLTLLALNRGGPWGWSTSPVVGLFGAGAVAFMLFAMVERRATHPLVPPQFFRLRNFSVPITVYALANFSYLGAFFLSPGLLKATFDMSNTGASQVMFWRPLVFSVSAPIAGRLAGRVGARPTAMVGAAAITTSMLVFVAGANMEALPLVVAALVLSGFGLGVMMPPITVLVANAVGDEHLGVASGAFQMLGQLGGTVGLQVLASVQDSSPGQDGYASAFTVGAAVATLATVATCFLRSEARSGPVSAAPVAGQLPGVFDAGEPVA